MLTRLLGSCLLASGITLVLFWTTTSLIATEESEVKIEPGKVVTLVKVRPWRYSPKIEDGRAIERRGLRISIPFRRGGGERDSI